MIDFDDTVVAVGHRVSGSLRTRPGAVTVRRLSEHCYWLEVNGYQSTVVVGERSALLIDPPDGGRTEPMVLAVREALRREISTVLYSHGHPDHTLGAVDVLRLSGWRGSMQIVCTRGCADVLNVAVGSAIPAPTRVLAPGERLGFEGVELTATVVGGHTPESTLFFVPVEEVAHVVDLIHPAQAEFFSFGGAVGLAHYEAALDHLHRAPWHTLTAGHGQLGRPDDVALLRRYLGDLRDSTAEALTTDAARSPGVDAAPPVPHQRMAALRIRVRGLVRPGLLDRWQGDLPGLEYTADSHIDRYVDELLYYS